MGDLTKTAGQWVASNIPLSVGVGLFLFCLFFEISKIKIYPLRWLWKGISWPFRKIDEQRTASFKVLVQNMKTELNTSLKEMKDKTTDNCNMLKARFDQMQSRFDEIDQRFADLDKRQDATDERIDHQIAARIKNHVFNFARQCRKGEPHSRADFVNLFEEHKVYCKLVEHYGWVNNVYSHDFSYIESVYDELNRTNGFAE